VLVRLGYEVEVVDSGQRAYELFSRALASGQRPFDVVLMDMLLAWQAYGMETLAETVQRVLVDDRPAVSLGTPKGAG
jgi:hypothetical protein